MNYGILKGSASGEVTPPEKLVFDVLRSFLQEDYDEAPELQLRQREESGDVIPTLSFMTGYSTPTQSPTDSSFPSTPRTPQVELREVAEDPYERHQLLTKELLASFEAACECFLESVDEPLYQALPEETERPTARPTSILEVETDSMLQQSSVIVERLESALATLKEPTVPLSAIGEGEANGLRLFDTMFCPTSPSTEEGFEIIPVTRIRRLEETYEPFDDPLNASTHTITLKTTITPKKPTYRYQTNSVLLPRLFYPTE